jgi:hypothetical protein
VRLALFCGQKGEPCDIATVRWRFQVRCSKVLLKSNPKAEAENVETKPLYKIPEAYEYLRHAVSIDALYAIARLKLVPVLRCGRGPFQYPQASLDRLASGEVDLSAIVSRRNLQRQRR